MSVKNALVWLIRISLASLLAVGGVQGCMILFPSMFQSLGLVPILFATFYAASIVAAILLLRSPRIGLLLTLLLMFVQAPRVLGPRLEYRLASGFGSWVTQSDEGWRLTTNRTSCFTYSRTTGFGPQLEGPTYYGLNIVAAIGSCLALGGLALHRQHEPIEQFEPAVA